MQEESNNLNITPDMINNLAGMLKNSNKFQPYFLYLIYYLYS